MSTVIAPQTVLVFGLESVSYERSRLDFRWVLREISARAFFVKITKKCKSHISNISRILGIMETSISNISRILENKKINFPICPGYEQIDIIRFPIFPGFWSANLIFGINFALRFRLEMKLIMTPRNYYTWLWFRSHCESFNEEGVGVVVKRKGYVRKLLPRN